MLERGFTTIGQIRRAPLRMHWTAPLGILILGGLSIPASLGLFLTFLVHELGHAFLVWRFRLSVLSIDIHGLGGLCRWAGPATDVQRALIAWGGVLAQIVLIAIAQSIAKLGAGLVSPMIGDTLSYLTAINLLMIGLNLVPIRPLDGAEAWPLFRFRNLRALWRRTSLRVRKAAIEREIAGISRELAASEREKNKRSSRDSN